MCTRAFRVSLGSRAGLRALGVALLAVVAGLLGACAEDTAIEPVEGDTIIVSGASGQLGGLVVEQLIARGVSPQNLILVSRTPDRLQRYRMLGADTRYGDFSEPESLSEAYAGGDRLLLISIGGSGAPRVRLHENAIDAAVAAGVEHIVYTSLSERVQRLHGRDQSARDAHLRVARLRKRSRSPHHTHLGRRPAHHREPHRCGGHLV
jgi:hypothetical protein